MRYTQKEKPKSSEESGGKKRSTIYTQTHNMLLINAGDDIVRKDGAFGCVHSCA